MRIEHMLRPEAVVCATTDNLVTIARRMREYRVSALAVCADERLIATISERDLVRAMAEGADPHVVRGQVYAAAVRDTADPTEDSWQVAGRMLETGLDHLAVLDGSTVVNVVTLGQLIAVDPRHTEGGVRTSTLGRCARIRVPVGVRAADAQANHLAGVEPVRGSCVPSATQARPTLRAHPCRTNNTSWLE